MSSSGTQEETLPLLIESAVWWWQSLIHEHTSDSFDKDRVGKCSKKGSFLISSLLDTTPLSIWSSQMSDGAATFDCSNFLSQNRKRSVPGRRGGFILAVDQFSNILINRPTLEVKSFDGKYCQTKWQKVHLKLFTDGKVTNPQTGCWQMVKVCRKTNESKIWEKVK